MNKIISFLIYNLKKNSFIEYLHVFIEKAETCPTVLVALAQWFAVLKAKFAEAERIHHITLKSPLTELISMVDAQRDSVIVALKALARSYEKSEDGQKRDLARALMVGLDSIKHNNNDQYIEQTGQVDNLLYFLQVQEAAAVESLGLSSTVALLKSVNDRMHELIEGKVVENENKDKGAFEKARADAEEAYRQFVLGANSWAFVNADKMGDGASEEEQTISLAEFFKWANANILLYNSKLFKQPATELDKEEEDAEGDADGETDESAPEQTPGETPEQKPEDSENTGSDNGNQGGSGDNTGDNTGGGNNGNYPPGYDPDADDDPGV